MKCIWNSLSHNNTDFDSNTYMPIYIGKGKENQVLLCQHDNAMC